MLQQTLIGPQLTLKTLDLADSIKKHRQFFSPFLTHQHHLFSLSLAYAQSPGPIFSGVKMLPRQRQ